MPAPRTFHLTRHLKLRVDQRELSVDSLKDVIKCPDWRHQQRRGEHGGFVYRFEKTVFEGKTLVVVAEVKKSECWIISGFFI